MAAAAAATPDLGVAGRTCAAAPGHHSPADLLRRRFDLRAAGARVRAAWARKEQARRAGWPGSA
jgi:outer membrane protein TolC